MALVKNPSPQHLHTLYNEHNGWLQQWLRGRLGNAWDAADLAHDTFLRLLRRPLDDLGERPRALLTHIAKGLLVDRWRRQEIERAYLASAAALPEDQMPGPETRELILEALERIDAALSELPTLAREAFLLSQLDGLTYPLIAEHLGVSLASVKRYMRAGFIACLGVA